MSEINHHTDYRQALAAIKQRIQTSQIRAVLAVNVELLGLYWDIARQLEAWQCERAWGSAVVEHMAQDLQASYPGMKGFSRTSLFAMRQFYAFSAHSLKLSRSLWDKYHRLTAPHQLCDHLAPVPSSTFV